MTLSDAQKDVIETAIRQIYLEGDRKTIGGKIIVDEQVLYDQLDLVEQACGIKEMTI